MIHNVFVDNSLFDKTGFQYVICWNRNNHIKE